MITCPPTNLYSEVPILARRPETVAEGILELATDTTKAGRVMTVTNRDGIRYARLFGDAKL